MSTGTRPTSIKYRFLLSEVGGFKKPLWISYCKGSSLKQSHWNYVTVSVCQWDFSNINLRNTWNCMLKPQNSLRSVLSLYTLIQLVFHVWDGSLRGHCWVPNVAAAAAQRFLSLLPPGFDQGSHGAEVCECVTLLIKRLTGWAYHKSCRGRRADLWSDA